jgi:hypothetical protein
MTDRNELVHERHIGWLDTDTLDRMLAGGIHPDDAPPGYSEVAGVLLAVAEARGPEELVHEAAHVLLAVELVQQRAPISPFSDRRSSRRSKKTRSRSHRGKIGGLVVIGAMVGSTGLAAAGVLPDAAQDAFSHVLDKVGITVPARSHHPASSGEELSRIATTTDSTGADKGAEISSVASGGKSHAGQHGSAAAAHGARGAPPRHEPNGGGTGTADAASKGASGHGTSTGDAASDGRSRAGSGNASVARSASPRASKPPAHIN